MMDYKVVLDQEEEKLLKRYMQENNVKYKAQACRELLVMGTTAIVLKNNNKRNSY